MSETKICRLCVSNCNDFGSLYDEHAHISQPFQLLAKYFDAACLNMIQGSNLTVICSECWSQIFNFHNFQQSVYEAQNKLLNVMVIKSEPQTDLQPHERIFESNQYEKFHVKCEDECTAGCSTKILYPFNDSPDKDEAAICQPKLEIIDVFASDDDSENDKSQKWISEHRELTSSGILNYDDDSIDIDSSKSEATYMLYSPDEKMQMNDCEMIEDKLKSKSVGRKHDSSIEKSTNCKKRDIEADDFIAQWKSKVTCVVCSDSYPTYTLLRQHFRKKHPFKKFYILCCQRKFARRSILIDHIRFHIDPNIYKCELCDTRIISREGYIKHRRFHKTSSSDTDKAPKKMFRRTKSQLDLYIAQWKPTLDCYLCSETRSSFTLLQRHFRQEHCQEQFHISCCQRKLKRRYEIEEHIQLHNDPNAFKCKQCDRCLSSRGHLHTHMLTYHSNPTENSRRSKPLNINQSKKRNALEVDEIIAQWKDNLECSVCTESFSSFSSLRTHFEQSHTHASLFIDCCNRRLKKQFRILEHARFHVDPNAFKCDLCSKCFSTQTNLKVHVRRQHYQ